MRGGNVFPSPSEPPSPSELSSPSTPPGRLTPPSPDTSTFQGRNLDRFIPPDQFCVLADLLIPGRGEPIREGCLVIDDTKIVYAGKAADAGSDYKYLPTTRVKVLTPGLWDCHVHFIGAQKLDMRQIANDAQNQALVGARSAMDARIILNAGFTSVREVGGYGVQLAKAVEEGTIIGPKIYAANQAISTTGGHADIHSLHKPWYDDACSHGMPLITADGVAECMKAVRMQLRAGAKLIKICASGGAGSEMDDPKHQQFTDEEMKIMVEVAANAHRIVAAHCHGKPGIMGALRAGVKTIEHGSYLDEEAADLMIEKGAILVSTRLIVENVLSMKDMIPPHAYKDFVETGETHWHAMKLAIRKNVKMAIGTDTNGSIPGSDVFNFGRVGTELYYHVKAGMTPLQAIEAATATAVETLGPQAPRSGLLKSGYDADFIALDENPLDDISIIGKPKHVTHVWRQGKCYKSPGNPIGGV